MKKIFGYCDIKKVVGIPSTSYIGYNNYSNSNRFFRRQKENTREQRKYKEFALRKPQQTNEVAKTYTSEDEKIIYFMEYCKVRNTKIYGQLNPSVNTSIIDYSSQYPEYDTSQSNNVNKMLEEYSQMSREKNVIIDFEARKSTTSSNKPVKKQEVKPIVTRKEEMNRFKNLIKEQANIQDDKKAQLDRAVMEFEEALRKRKAYEAQTKGFRQYRGRNIGRERD